MITFLDIKIINLREKKKDWKLDQAISSRISIFFSSLAQQMIEKNEYWYRWSPKKFFFFGGQQRSPLWYLERKSDCSSLYMSWAFSGSKKLIIEWYTFLMWSKFSSPWNLHFKLYIFLSVYHNYMMRTENTFGKKFCLNQWYLLCYIDHQLHDKSSTKLF